MASVFISTPAEIVLIDTRTRSGTVTLPTTGQIAYRVLSFKDQYGAFSNSTFTLSTQTGQAFDDGTTSKTFSNAFTSINLYAATNINRWMVMNATQTVQQSISSLIVNQLVFGTGAGWVQFGPLQASVVSTIQVNTNDTYTNNLFVGNQSTINEIQYWGLYGNYNNTALAEISTGAGIQELLLFKGSSTSDRVRIQTTGNFVVETGVSARLFNSNTLQTLSNATPAFIINTSSNVGIQLSNPGTTLDVGGTGRFQLASTLRLQASTIGVLNVPTLLFWSDACKATSNGSTSLISSFKNIFLGSNLLQSNNSANARLILPYTGSYYFEVSGWICGPGTGMAGIIARRGANTVYQRLRANAIAGCGIYTVPFFWNLFQAGDILQFYKNENNTGLQPNDVTTTNQVGAWNIAAGDENQGPMRVWYYGGSGNI